jgi:hypothetical protein
MAGGRVGTRKVTRVNKSTGGGSHLAVIGAPV